MRCIENTDIHLQLARLYYLPSLLNAIIETYFLLVSRTSMLPFVASKMIEFLEHLARRLESITMMKAANKQPITDISV